MDDKTKSNLINDYLCGKLSKTTNTEFTKKILEDPDFLEEVTINKHLFALFNTDEWEEITQLNDTGIAYQKYLLSDNAKKAKMTILKCQKIYNTKNNI